MWNGMGGIRKTDDVRDDPTGLRIATTRSRLGVLRDACWAESGTAPIDARKVLVTGY